MIQNAISLIQKASRGKFAIPQFNTSTLETTKAVLKAAYKLKSPLFVATSEGEASFLDPFVFVSLIKALVNGLDLDIIIHLDHAKNIDLVRSCLKAGYTSVHIDGSDLSFNENVALTQAVVNLAKNYKASVEGELGHIAGHSTLNQGDIQKFAKKEFFTDPDKAAEFVEKTDVNMLAIAIGSAHGIYAQPPKLDFDRLQEIQQKTQLPLVLHGGSGIPDKEIKKAIEFGICKVNVNTELRAAFILTLREVLKQNPDEVVPYHIFPKVMEAVCKVAEDKIKVFGSQNKV